MVDFRSAFASPNAPPEHGAQGDLASPGLQQPQRDGLAQATDATYYLSKRQQSPPTMSKRARLRGGHSRQGDPSTTTPSSGARTRPWTTPSCWSRVFLPNSSRFSVRRGSPSTMAGPGEGAGQSSHLQRVWQSITTFARFVGPGFMVAVAYSKSWMHVRIEYLAL